jgi:hypothetical protein
MTRMDSRSAPLQMLGLFNGDTKILRNAGARVTDDVLRTLMLVTHLLGANRVMVVAHADCRMTKGTDDQIHATIASSPASTRAAWSSAPSATSRPCSRPTPRGSAAAPTSHRVPPSERGRGQTGRIDVLVPGGATR